jgi:hypothetical protein
VILSFRYIPPEATNRPERSAQKRLNPRQVTMIVAAFFERGQNAKALQQLADL